MVQPLIPAEEAAIGAAASCDWESTDVEPFAAEVVGGTEMLGAAEGVAAVFSTDSVTAPVSASPTAGA
jgi:hypothetical protein